MIGEFILNIVFGIVSRFFAMLPEISWDVDASAANYLISVLRVAGYMFPWNTVIRILGVVVSISLFRITVSFIKTLWNLLPFV